jgi:hypothetical protein
MQHRVFQIGVLIAFGSTPIFADTSAVTHWCRANPQVSGACFVIRGRASAFEGSPSIRIWPIGSNRLLGISEGRYNDKQHSNAPADLEQALSAGPNATYVYGSFEVCPFEPDVLGLMRLVCVETVRGMRVVHHGGAL